MLFSFNILYSEQSTSDKYYGTLFFNARISRMLLLNENLLSVLQSDNDLPETNDIGWQRTRTRIIEFV